MEGKERLTAVAAASSASGGAVASFYSSVVSRRKEVITLDSDEEDGSGDVVFMEDRVPTSTGVCRGSGDDIVCGFVCGVCRIQVTTMSERKHNASSLHLINVAAANKSPPAQTYVIPRGNIGYKMLLRSGWEEGSGLGRDGQGMQAPVKTRIKNDRLGLGSKSASKLRVTHKELPPKRRNPERGLPPGIEQSSVFTALRHLRASKQRQQPLGGVSKRQRQLRVKRDRIYTRILTEELRGAPSLRDLAD